MNGLKLTAKVIAIFIGAWLLAHIMGVFGFFLAIAYLSLWIFFPKNTPCFGCRTVKEGSVCPLCNATKTSDSEPYPKSIRSAFLNFLLIAVVSLLSGGAVFAENIALKELGFFAEPKTATFSIPDKGKYMLGEIFPVKIQIDGVKTPINTVQADIAYSPSKLKVVEISTEDSFATIFIQKDFNNELGYARLTGGLPSPGFSGSLGTFGIVYFQCIEPGVAEVEFLPTSLILANDGAGTNVIKELTKASYLILPEEIGYSENTSIKTLVREDKLSETQMLLYVPTNADSQQRVLGTYEERNALGQKAAFGTTYIQNTLTTLQKIDAKIVGFWKSFF
jgi:hypothetical protein